MIRNINKYILVLFCIIPLLGIISCKEEISPFNNNDWEPGMAFPIANASLTLGDLIPEENQNFYTDDNGLVHFIFREDSLIGFTIDDILEISDQQDEEVIFKLGEISLDNFGPLSTYSTLGEMLEMLDTATAATIQLLDGTTTFFPSMTSVAPKDFDFSDFDDFEYVTFSEGELILKVTNMLPVTFSTCNVSLKTISPTGDSIHVGDFTFTDFISLTIKTETMQLAGMTLYNDFVVTVNNFTTETSATPVLVDMNGGLEFIVTSSNLKVIAGKAKIPSQTISNLGDSIDLSLDSQERLTYLELNEATINYEVESSIDLGFNFILNMPYVTIDGIPVEFSFSASGQSTGSFDMSNSIFDLTQNPEQPYNNFAINFNFDIQGTNEWVEFDSSSTVRLNYSIGNIDFQLAQGWMGVHNYIMSDDSVYTGFGELENIAGSVMFSDPELKILVNNNLGLPVGFQIDIISYSTDGNSVNLGAGMQQFPYPTTPYSFVDSFISFNNQTSNLSEFLSFLPQLLVLGGEVITNPDSANTGIVYNNFITKDGKVNLGIEFEMPVAMTINNLQFSDTLDFNMDDIRFEDAVSGHFSIYTVNGMPLDAKLYLTFVDSANFIPLDEYEIELLTAALVDIDGKVTSSTESTTIIEMNPDKFDQLAIANKIIITAIFNTTNSEAQDVIFMSDYTMDVHLAALINYQIVID